MSNSFWLDTSNNANKLAQTYLQGFLDISGGNFTMRNGNTDLYGNLNVTRDASFNGNINAKTLTVSGNTTINSNLLVIKDISLNANTYVNRLVLSGDASMNGNLYVIKDVSFNANTFANRLILSGDASMNNNLYVLKDVSFNANTYVDKTLTVKGHIFATLDASLNSNVIVGKDLTINGNAYAQKNIYISGNIHGSVFDVNGTNTTINIGPSNVSKTINIGGPANTVNSSINIGGNADVINIRGNISNAMSFLTVNNGNIILNGNSVKANSTVGVGIKICDNGNVNAGYIRVAQDMSGYLFKAPNSNTVVNFNMGNMFIGSTSVGDNTKYPLKQGQTENAILTISSQSGTDASSIIQAANVLGDFLLRDNNKSASSYQAVSTSISLTGNVSIGKLNASSNQTYPLDISGATRIVGSTYLMGNVGIGTTTTAYNLDVSGIISSGTIYTSRDISANGLTIGKGNASVSSNTAFGFEALNKNVTSSQNTAIGYQALFSNTAGGNNHTAIGNQALNQNTTGGNNVGIGASALFSNITGSNNVGIGTEALRDNNNSYNTAVGHQAALENTSGMRIVAVGFQAAYKHTTGSRSVYVGSSAGNNNTSGDNNIFIGHNSGGNTVTSSNNTFLGINTTNISDLSYSTAIGYNAAITAANQIMLGTASETVFCPNKLNVVGDAYLMRNVGIGTTNPQYPLDISGNTRVLRNTYLMGNVGVGTTSPQYSLDINGGNLRITSSVISQSAYNYPPSSLTGGITTAYGNYVYSVFTSSGTITFPSTTKIGYLVIGGGGGGGGGGNGIYGAGANTGDISYSLLSTSNVNLIAGTPYTITVGPGGTGRAGQSGNSGSSSSIGSLVTANGGRAGGSGTSSADGTVATSTFTGTIADGPYTSQVVPSAGLGNAISPAAKTANTGSGGDGTIINTTSTGTASSFNISATISGSTLTLSNSFAQGGALAVGQVLKSGATYLCTITAYTAGATTATVYPAPSAIATATYNNITVTTGGTFTITALTTAAGSNTISVTAVNNGALLSGQSVTTTVGGAPFTSSITGTPSPTGGTGSYTLSNTISTAGTYTFTVTNLSPTIVTYNTTTGGQGGSGIVILYYQLTNYQAQTSINLDTYVKTNPASSITAIDNGYGSNDVTVKTTAQAAFNTPYTTVSQERMRITGSGNVGFGTSSPQYLVDISGNTRISGNTFLMGNVGIGTTSPAYFVDITGNTRISGNTYLMGTNVGVGTTNPQYPLDIRGNTQILGNTYLMGTNVGVGTTSPAYPLDIAVNTRVSQNTYLMGTNVGIGTTSPAYPLDITGITRVLGNTYLMGTNVGVGTTSPAYPLDIRGNTQILGNAYLMGTNVGIGTTSPAYPLDITGNTRISGSAYLMGTNVGVGTTNPQYPLDIRGNTQILGNTYLMGTNIGIGTTNPQYPLDITGITRVLGNTYLMGTNVGIGTTNPKYLMDINGGNLRISSSLISQSAYNLPVTSSVTPITYININGTAYAYMAFTQNGTITFPTDTKIGYILIGGGGGGGGYGNSSGIGYGGPGTAGNIILQPLSTSTTSLNGAIQINIGSGGVQSSNPSSGNNGENTTITQGGTTIKTTSNGQNNYGIGGIYTSGSIGSASSNTNNNIATLNDINQSSSTTNGYGGAGGYLTNGTITSYSFYTTTSTPNSTSFTGNIAISSGSLTLSSSFPGGELVVGQLINNNCVILIVNSSTTATVYPLNTNLTRNDIISVGRGASTFTASITFAGTKNSPTMTVTTHNPIYPIIVNQTFTYSGTTFTITSINSLPTPAVYSLSASTTLSGPLSDSNRSVTITRTQPTFTKYTYDFYNTNPGNAGSNGFALIYYQLTNYNRQTSIGLDTYITSKPASSIVAIDNGFGSNDVTVNTTNPATYNETYNPVSQERLRITASGYVGIGTNSPQYPLDIYGSTHIDDDLQIEGVLTVNNDSTIMGDTNIGGNTSLMQKVGIGKINPAYDLDVSGTIYTTKDITINGLTVGRGGNASVDTNSAFGIQALNKNTNGTNNTAVGYKALQEHTYGDYIVAIGNEALVKDISGYQSTVVGYQAACKNTSGYNIQAFGFQAAFENTTGNNSVYFGAVAGKNNTTGSSNTFIGHESGKNTITGSYNTFLGINTTNTGDRSRSTAIGYNATITADNQIMLGTTDETVVCPNNLNVKGNSYLMQKVGIGKINPAYDLDVSGTIYTSKDININGLTVGRGNASVDTNSAFGYQALQNTTEGYQNTAIGYQAIQLNTSGFNNVAVGCYAGQFNTIGSDNIFIGVIAGQFNTTGSCNTFIGRESGKEISTGNNNSFLGFLSSSSSNCSNSTAIGYKATITASNQIMLGTTDETVVCPSNCNVINNISAANLPKFWNCSNLFGRSVNITGTDRFLKIGTLGDWSNNGNYSSMIINGTIGGLDAGTQATVNITIITRGLTSSAPFITGSAYTNGTNYSWISDYVDFVIYYNNVPVSATGISSGPQYHVYLRLKKSATVGGDSYIHFDFTVTGNTSNTSAVILNNPSNTYSTTIPTGTATTVLSNLHMYLYNGSMTFPKQVTAQSYNATSDYRIKENVEPLDSHYTVDNLRPVHYDNIKSKQHAIGFIAHEVQEHYPFLVDGEKDGDKTQSLNYNGLIGILVNEIQLLKKTVQEMKTEIQTLKSTQ